jgi:GntR family transcriptional regulator
MARHITPLDKAALRLYECLHTMKQQPLTACDRLLAALRLEQSGVPIYVQLRDQVLRTLAGGLLQPGERMPTMRQVAVALKIDLNTVRRGYDELTRIGAITVEHGRGSFVARPPAGLDREAEIARIDGLARQTLATAHALGIDPRALTRRLSTLLQEKEETP